AGEEAQDSSASGDPAEGFDQRMVLARCNDEPLAPRTVEPAHRLRRCELELHALAPCAGHKRAAPKVDMNSGAAMPGNRDGGDPGDRRAGEAPVEEPAELH